MGQPDLKLCKQIGELEREVVVVDRENHYVKSRDFGHSLICYAMFQDSRKSYRKYRVS